MRDEPLNAHSQVAWLDGARLRLVLAWAIPLLFGVYSLALGQDANWDLLNYHRYNPFAILNGKVGFDLAPGQWQSYFNPTLDLFYHALNSVLPAPGTGFVMGALHGLNLVLLLAIARCVVVRAGAHPGVAVLLAVAACFGPSFRLQVGNTMGDNSTALLILLALYVLLSRAGRLEREARWLVLAGVAAGLACGLKLTNAMYALALCLALFALDMPWLARLRCAFVFGVAVLVGMALSAGWWYWTMWSTFGNPLFPQFNNIFKGPLAWPIGIGDAGWQPKNLGERLLWPFIFTLDYKRVIELPIRQLVFPLLYLLYWGLVGAWIWARVKGRAVAQDPLVRFTLLFVALAYGIWVHLFGIYRYLVVLELVAPLAVWLLLVRLAPAPWSDRAACALLALCCAVAVPLPDWGHARWHREAFRADLPVVAVPAQSMVFTVTGDPPLGWIVPSFPVGLAFVSVDSGFPHSDLYHERVRGMLAARSGPIHLMLPAFDAPDAEERRKQYVATAGERLARYGVVPVAGSCRRHTAWIGAEPRYFDWCLVEKAR